MRVSNHDSPTSVSPPVETSDPGPETGRRFGLLPRVSLLILATILTLGALEGAARLYARATKQVRGMTFDPELGWKPIPNISKIDSIWGVTRPASTNSHGWRDRERTYDKPPGTFRAVAIGDSFTFGVDVDDGERFTDVLPELVPSLEVVNLGVAGYGIDQELRVLETQAFRYDPDVILLTVCVYNDLTDIGYERIYSWPKPYYRLEHGALQLLKPEYTWEMRARTSSYLVEFLFQRLRNEDLTPRTAEGSSIADAAPLFRALLQQIAAGTASHGSRLVAVLAYPPHRFGPTFTPVAQMMSAALERAGVPTVDTRALFQSQSPDPDATFYNSFGVHWNARGHRAVAQAVSRLLTPAAAK